MNELLEKTKYTMIDYCKEIGETLEGLWTVRITPEKMERNITKDEVKEILNMIYVSNQRVKKILCFEEGNAVNHVKRHYHLRLVTDYKTKKSLYDLIKERFPIGKKGNGSYSIHNCREKDKTLWKSATYIAKGGDCVCHHGYDEGQVAQFIKVGRQMSVNASTPIWKKIATIYLFDGLVELSSEYCFDCIVNWYEENDKILPMNFHIKQLMHNLLYKYNSHYREKYKDKLILEFEELCNPQHHSNWT